MIFSLLENMIKWRLKTGAHHAIFWILEINKSKILHKIEQKPLFFFIFLVSFFMVFLTQKPIYTINV